MLLSITHKPFNIVKVIMARRYSSVFTDDDLQEINTQKVKLHLDYKGLGSKSSSYVLYLEQ